MKKVLSIVLILAVVLSTAFAGATGSATVEFGFDLDKGEYGFENTPEQMYLVKFAYKTGNEAEGDLRAEIEAEFGLTNYWTHAYGFPIQYGISDETAGLKATAQIKKANIIYKDLTVGILGAGGGYDFASSFQTKMKANQTGFESKFDYVKGKKNAVAGLTVAYKGIGQIGLGFHGETEVKKNGQVVREASSEFFLQASSDELSFLEDSLKIQAAGTMYLEKGKNAFFVGAKAGYAIDKFSANVGLDLGINEGVNPKDATKTVYNTDFEARATIGYDFVSADVYYALAEKVLDAKASAKIAVNETVTITPSVEALNLLQKDQQSIKGAVEANVDAFKASASVKYGFAKTLDVTVKAEYKPETFYAEASFGLGFDFSGDKAKTTSIAPSIKVGTESLINGADIYAKWEGELAKDAEEPKKGKIAIGATIGF